MRSPDWIMMSLLSAMTVCNIVAQVISRRPKQKRYLGVMAMIIYCAALYYILWMHDTNV